MRLDLRRESWNLGIIPEPVETIVKHGITTPVQWLLTPRRWEFYADPACYPLGADRLVLLAERLSYWTERGEIWAAVVNRTDWSKITFQPWLKANFHLSYPFPFADGDTLYLVCESWETGRAFLWQRINDSWQMCGPILEKPAIDVTVWHGQDHWWLFCTMADDHPNERLYIFFADRPRGPWHRHPANPVKVDASSSRPAGPLFECDGKLIRPAQDCSFTYGGAIVLNVIDQLDEHGFVEHPLRRLAPDRMYPHGIHTICPAGPITLVDGKRWDVHPLDVARKSIVPLTKRIRHFRLPQWPNHVTDLI